MNLPRTRIEYGTHAWNFCTGCANGPDICKVSEDCWARGISWRFKTDFTPTFHEDRFNVRFPSTPSVILVCFTGDISYAEQNVRLQASQLIAYYWEHTFLLLTKRPEIAYAGIEWPKNAWLGISLTGAETPERQ